MRKELDDVLCAVAPKLYAQRHETPTRTGMCWGFPGDGWFSLIFEASVALEKLDEEVEATQVKEKFGVLSLYVSGRVSVKACQIIDRAVKRSCVECEDCGAAGKRVGNGYLRTLCEQCWTIRQEEDA